MQGIWGSYFNIPKAIFYLLKGDYSHMLAGTLCVLIGTGRIMTCCGGGCRPYWLNVWVSLEDFFDEGATVERLTRSSDCHHQSSCSTSAAKC